MDWLWCMIPERCFSIVKHLIECVEPVLKIESYALDIRGISKNISFASISDCNCQ